MRRMEYELEQRIRDMLGPPPGPEQLVLDQFDADHFAWHLEAQGTLIAPEEASDAWRAYVHEALCRLGRTPGTGVQLPTGAKHHL